jgi:hypothetical protein
MTNLEIKKAASDLAFNIVTQNGPAGDLAIANQAAQLQLSDPQYQQFKNAVAGFKQQYAQAASQDAQAAAQAAAAAKAQNPAPAPNSDLPAAVS